MKQIETNKAPMAIGPYSQAICVGNMIYCSGQIPLDPMTMTLVDGIEAQVEQTFKNLQAVLEAAGATIHSVIKLTIYLIDLNDFETVNQAMKDWWQPPYPARVTLGVSALPKGARIEVEAIATL